MTNKTATATATLVAAVPAAALGFFLVKTFLTGLGQMPTTFLGLYGVTLAACAAVVFLPFAVLIFGAKSPARRPASASASDGSEKELAAEKGPESGEPAVEESFDQSEPEVAAEAVEEAVSEPTSTGELEIVEPTASDADLEAVEGFDEVEPPTQAFDAEEDFTFDDEIEEEPPKKKKK